MNIKIMGILNITPDSFYDGGKFFSKDCAIERAMRMVDEGVHIIDIGGESTRPGAKPISEDEELQRVIPVVTAIRERSAIPLSIDTMKPSVAEAAAHAGINMINDITGFEDERMITVAKQYQTDICVMHMQGTPQNMQRAPFYPNGIIDHLMDWFRKKTVKLQSFGIKKEKIIIDPGIGFGKTVEDNVKILQNVPTLLKLGFPILIGLSRKSFLGKICEAERAELLPATITANALAVCAGAHMIRVHDVREHRDMLKVLQHYKASE